MPTKTSIIHQYFDHVYVLNLTRRTDRKRSMQQKLKQLGIQAEFVAAVDGYTTENKNAFEAYLKIPLLQPDCHPLEKALKIKVINSPGAWGYLKTYVHILRDAQNCNYKRILCLDDDAIFHKNFEHQFANSIQQLPTVDWKLLYLGASQKEWKIGIDLDVPVKTQNLPDEKSAYYFPLTTDGSFAVGIDSSIYPQLLKEVLKMNCTFDSGPLRNIIQTYPKKCLVLYPNLVVADLSESDIRTGKNMQEWADYYKWKLKDYNWAFQKISLQIFMKKVKRKLLKFRQNIIHQ